MLYWSKSSHLLFQKPRNGTQEDTLRDTLLNQKEGEQPLVPRLTLGAFLKDACNVCFLQVLREFP